MRIHRGTPRKWFCYTQNNSEGSFVIDRENGISEVVWIQAPNALEANKIAQDKGIYFNGVKDGKDCECCGNRWREVDDSDAHDCITFHMPADLNRYSFPWFLGQYTVFFHRFLGVPQELEYSFKIKQTTIED